MESYVRKGCCDGKIEQHRIEYQKSQKCKDTRKKYYQEHREEILQKRKEAYANRPEDFKRSVEFQKRKKKILSREKEEQIG